MIPFILASFLLQAAPIGSALGEDVQLVYESAGVEQTPWSYDSVRVVEREEFERCVIVARRGQEPRESCVRGDTLFDARAGDGGGAYRVARPVGPDMSLAVPTASGNVLAYSTDAAATRHVPGVGELSIVSTTILTRDATGDVIRRLREDYAPSLLTAVWGVFEETDEAGGWRVVREFSLAEVRRETPETKRDGDVR